jgi:NADPH-dependent curcumin reductase CurA
MTTFEKLVCTELSPDFRRVTKIERVPLPTKIPPKQVLVRNIWTGINASDVNWTAGKYVPGMQPPFDCGFEAIGQIIQVGSAVKGGGFQVGQYCLHAATGAFSEYQVVPAKLCMSIPSPKPEFLPLRVNAVTALASLEEIGQPKQGEIALVTAAAGGTGQFAVQLLKHYYGCHVIGTCSDEKKKAFLKSIGCDRVVDYKKENLYKVLKTEYKNGVDIVFESVGGSMFEAALKNLAIHGRLIVIGAIEGYTTTGRAKSISAATAEASQTKRRPPNWLQMLLISRSIRVEGFFLNHITKTNMHKYIQTILQLMTTGKVKSFVDNGISAARPGGFQGISQVADAIEYLHFGKNIGKVVVNLENQRNATAKL